MIILEMPGIEPGASYMQSMRSTTELHPPYFMQPTQKKLSEQIDSIGGLPCLFLMIIVREIEIDIQRRIQADRGIWAFGGKIHKSLTKQGKKSPNLYYRPFICLVVRRKTTDTKINCLPTVGLEPTIFRLGGGRLIH